MMLLFQVEQWKKKEPLERTCFPKHWTSHDNFSTAWSSLALAIRGPVFPFCCHSRNFTSHGRRFGRSSTFLLYSGALLWSSGTFLLYFATFLLYSGSASEWTKIFQNLKRTTFVLHVRQESLKDIYFDILLLRNTISYAILIDSCTCKGRRVETFKTNRICFDPPFPFPLRFQPINLAKDRRPGVKFHTNNLPIIHFWVQGQPGWQIRVDNTLF